MMDCDPNAKRAATTARMAGVDACVGQRSRAVSGIDASLAVCYFSRTAA